MFAVPLVAGSHDALAGSAASTGYIPDPVALAALLVSIAVAYVAEFRGPEMKMKLLRPPVDWNVNAGIPAVGKPGQGYFLSPTLAESFTLMVTAKCPGLVWNEGPKGGAVWDLMIDVDSPGEPWTVKGRLELSDPYTLSGKENAGFLARVEFFCHKDDLPAGLHILESATAALRVRLSYSGLRALGRRNREHSDVTIEPGELATRIRAWGAQSSYSLEPDASSSSTDTT